MKNREKKRKREECVFGENWKGEIIIIKKKAHLNKS